MTTRIASKNRPLAGAVWLLAVGPIVTVAALLYAHHAGALAALPLPLYLAVALAAWSPLPFSVPAVILDNYRDAYRPDDRGLRRVTRGALLVGHMLSARCEARAAFVASLAGFAAAAALAGPAWAAAI